MCSCIYTQRRISDIWEYQVLNEFLVWTKLFAHYKLYFNCTFFSCLSLFGLRSGCNDF